jgi:hypothetical protein
MARGKTVYLRSESGRVEDFDQFRQRLRKLATSENLRFKELRQLLKREAAPLVEKARQEAYNDIQTKSRLKLRGGSTATKKDKGAFYNLYKSIDVFANKGTEKAYVVVGLRNEKKKGAYYAKWQLTGAARPGRPKAGNSISQHRKQLENYTGKGFPAKAFFDKALAGSDVPEKTAQKITNFVQKRIKAHLR